ncbi:MAG: 16S rRNA (cytidine(1402)-2'-O)-methyltransferase [Candidatus Paceibacterota bacterium]
MANLYIICTPIGNLGDITLRALETLKSVDLVLCEDTRVTGKLLSHYGISVPTMSYHANSTIQKHDKIITLLSEGKSLALVSDAGTPTISDPGVLLIELIKKELPEVKIIPIPGASALTTALSVSGIPSPQFTFYGFLPHKKGRETLFKEISESSRTSVFYESPHRIEKTLESLVSHLDEDRRVVVARELTKMFEEVVSGNAKEVLNYFKENKDKVRGEFVVIVG